MYNCREVTIWQKRAENPKPRTTTKKKRKTGIYLKNDYVEDTAWMKEDSDVDVAINLENESKLGK